TGGIMKAIYLPPTSPKLYNEDGSLHWEEWEEMGSSSIYNPLRSQFVKTNANINNLISNLTVSYKVFEGLNFKTSIGYNDNIREATSKQSLLFYAPSERGVGFNLARTSIDHAKRTTWIIEPQLNYNSNLLNGRLDLTIGSTFQS